jgi:single-stranded DNA-specific DHH superfamily exonuclease
VFIFFYDEVKTMAITDVLTHIRDMLLASEKPLFFFDDDCDGLTSFLLLYRLVKKGKGMIIKSTPELDEKFVQKVEEYAPDLVIILDKPMVTQAFLTHVHALGVPVVWIDHHPPQEREHVLYCNPRLFDDSDTRPTSYWAWRIADQDDWIAMVGIVADWHLEPDVKDRFVRQYPGLIDEHVIRPEEALFNSKVGELVKIFSFNLKGKLSEVNTAIKIMTRLSDPNEVLLQASPRARLLFRKYERINALYAELLSSIPVTDDRLIFFTYEDNKTSLTSELSNELLYRHPDKVIVIAREKSGEMKCSIRSSAIVLPPLLRNAFVGLEGYGGGHDHACGACIKKKDFNAFLARFSKEINAA